jgi:ribonuclease-3
MATLYIGSPVFLVMIFIFGPDHAKNFRVGVYLDKDFVAEGFGTSKQEAQTEAAEAGLKVKGWKGPKINIITRKTGDPM